MTFDWHSDLPLSAFQVKFGLEHENYFRNFLGSWRIWSSSKITSENTRKYLRELGRFGHYFQGAREH